MNVGENEQLQMKCLVGLKSKPQNLKNLLAVISCGISYKGLLNDPSKFPSALIRYGFALSPMTILAVVRGLDTGLNAEQKLLLKATKCSKCY